MGLLTGNPRGATVRSQGEYTVCMRLAREPFTEVSEKWGDIMAFLRNVPLLREVMLHDEDFEMARPPARRWAAPCFRDTATPRAARTLRN